MTAVANLKQFTLRHALTLLLLLMSLPVAAQDSLIAGTPTYSAADSIRQVALEDTTYAVQRLFHGHRRRYAIQAVMRGLGAGFFGAYRLPKSLRESGKTEGKVVIALGTTILSYLFLRSAINLYRYRGSREKKLLTGLEQGRPLPTQIRRRLKPTYFSAPQSSK